MSASSVLDLLTLGYRVLWGRQRQPVSVELFIAAGAGHTGVDARHLVSTLTELWPARAPRLLLTLRSRALLHDMLVHGTADGAWIAVPQEALADPELRLRTQQARQRGLPLVWRGGPGELPDPELATLFQCGMYNLDEAQALQALSPGGNNIPALAGQVMQSPASHILADWALDQQGAWAVAGWPLDETLGSLKHQPQGPARASIAPLLRAIDQDASLDRIEELLGADPVLAYRFLQHVNSPALKLRGSVESLRHGLMVLGLGNVQMWLQAQLAQAGDAPDLQPVRTQLVTRARLFEHLLDPGEEDELRREVYLCGLLSQIDLLLGEPLAGALERLPLSERVREALLAHSGPYHPTLALARALESPDLRTIHLLCDSYGLAPGDVNRALLRTLAGLVT
jgi:hypothetical protein